MKYIFSESKLVFEQKPGSTSNDQSEFLDLSKKPKTEKEKKEVTDEKRKGLLKKNKENRKKFQKGMTLKSKSAVSKDLVKKLSKKEIESAFGFIEKNKFQPKQVEAMMAISDKMSVYNLWSGGVRRLGKENGLKENQGFSRMAAQFAKQGEDGSGKYLEINLHGKSKFESNIGAGHICPPSWQKVKIVDKSGNSKIGIRKIPGIDDVDGHKVGYYDKNGEYLAVYTGYKIYPISILSETKQADVKSFDTQVKNENEYYVKNKKKLEEYAERSSYRVSQMEMTKAEIQKIRDKINSALAAQNPPTKLEKIKAPGMRVVAVAKWIAENENIYAKHCGNWVKRVYLIAGVTRQKGLYHNMDYARSNGQWKSKLDKNARPDARNGKNALNERPDLVANLQIGDWLWINNRNRFDVGGNHSLIFMGWKDKAAKIAHCASWSNNTETKSGKKGQRMITINFNKMPITHIDRASVVKDKFVRVSDEEMAEYEKFKSLSSNEKVKQGMTPFKVKVGYQMTKAEYGWYMNERSKAHALGRHNIQDRMRVLNEKYQILDGINDSAKMLGVSQKNMKYFMAYNDAVLRVESNYNVFCVNHRSGKIALSSAAGEYQIINSTYQEMKRKIASGHFDRDISDTSVLRNAKINAPRSELLTPYQRSIFHNLYAFSYAGRSSMRVMPMNEIFTQIRNAPNRKMRRSYTKLMYTYWRNGHAGARPFLRNLEKGIPLPETKEAAKKYFENHLSGSWQKKRGFSDFWGLMRTCNKYANRFEKNLSEL
jgi:hypothetical protein